MPAKALNSALKVYVALKQELDADGNIRSVGINCPNGTTVAERNLVGSAQYSNSDCPNGGVLKISDGQKLMNTLSSHHYLLITGQNLADIELLAKIFNMRVEVI